tara:strand:- start:105225 stop:106607 length:1383 start_codon:yes stop_codon:yes gene_type:complete
MKLKTLIAAFAVGLCTTSALHAAVSETEAARLGADLTPTGAEQAGNADGSIPAWTGDGVGEIPANFEAGSGYYPDPFAGEEKLYTVTLENMAEYADILSEGQKAMLQAFGADGYELNVYPTHRTFAAPQWFYDGSKTNATAAMLEDDGQRIAGNVAGVPFPIPQNGVEALWNHMIRWMGYQLQQVNDSYYVDANGKAILATTAINQWEFPMFMPFKDADREYGAKDVRWGYLRSDFTAPSRRAGEILLVHEPGADYTAGKGRSAWQYLQGQRRVRKAPAVSFDTPRAAAAGTATYDDAYQYNGSPERFDWKLVGKKEMLVPYNNYDTLFQDEVLDLLGDKFVKPEAIRFEKHRVWIVEGVLKDGIRHVYGKRRLLIDEDSWHALESMRWDGKGNLWRTGYSVQALVWDVPAPLGIAELSYDLLSGIYNFTGKPKPGTFKPTHDKTVQFFSPQGMARSGIR